MKKCQLLILLIIAGFTLVNAAPDWWDNPDNLASWTDYQTTGSVQNSGGSQAQDVIAKIDIGNLGIERNIKNIWVQVEWEATTGSGSLVTDPVSHTVKWTYDSCPASPAEALTNIDGADFLSHEGSFTPTHEVSIGNTFDNGNEFSLALDEQPECERIEIKFSVDPNSEINYRIEAQTVCWGNIEVGGDCPSPASSLYPGATDVMLLSFTMDTGTGGDVWWDKLVLASPMTADNTIVTSVKIQTAGGTTIAGPTAWNPTTPIIAGGSFYYSQTFDISSDQLINENQNSFKVLVDIASDAEVGSSVDIQIPDSVQVKVLSPGVVLNDNFPVSCSATLTTLATNLQALTASVEKNSITVSWQLGKSSSIAGFNVYRKTVDEQEYSKINSEIIQVLPTLQQNNIYYFKDNNVIDQETYYYMIEEISTTGFTCKSQPVSITFQSTSDVDNQFKPDEFALAQNYPNPFNPSTMIAYNLAVQSHVDLHIYDVTGRLIYTLVDETQSAGQHQVKWFGENQQGETVANGVYLLTMRAGEHIFNQKMTLLR